MRDFIVFGGGISVSSGVVSGNSGILTSCFAWCRVLPSSSDMTNRNVHIDAGSYVNCSVIAFDTDERKSERGQIAVAMRIHTYIVGPIISAPYTPNLFHVDLITFWVERWSSDYTTTTRTSDTFSSRKFWMFSSRPASARWDCPLATINHMKSCHGRFYICWTRARGVDTFSFVGLSVFVGAAAVDESNFRARRQCAKPITSAMTTFTMRHSQMTKKKKCI